MSGVLHFIKLVVPAEKIRFLWIFFPFSDTSYFQSVFKLSCQTLAVVVQATNFILFIIHHMYAVYPIWILFILHQLQRARAHAHTHLSHMVKQNAKVLTHPP